MSTFSRLSRVFSSSRFINFDDSSRFIIFSDCHRGDNSWADDFGRNQNLFFHALQYYHSAGFTYIEAGDGDELWEQRRFSDIRQAHSDCFWLMKRFHEQGRLYMIRGNHDAVKKNANFLQNNLWSYFDERKKKYEPLFPNLIVDEGLILQHSHTGYKLFIVHGHQGDPINDQLWKLGRFLVRHLLKPLQLVGVKNPTSPAKNLRKKGKTEKKIIHWIVRNRQPVLAGHTHRPMFPDAGQPAYFNSGSCVHPRCITGMEIQNNEITLIKWSISAARSGALFITRSVIAGPMRLEAYH